MYFLDEKGNKIEEPESCINVLDSSVYHPEYNLRISIHEPKFFVNPLYAYILIVTFDETSGVDESNPEGSLPSSHCSILGFA